MEQPNGRKTYTKEEIRAMAVSTKPGAVCNMFLELHGIINKSRFARTYFNRSQSWFSQRVHGSLVDDKEVRFTEAEYHQLAESLRDFAMKLNSYADEIDAAEMYKELKRPN